MSSCANLLNQISAQLCQMKKKMEEASCGMDIATIQSAIFKHKDTVLNLVKDNEHTKGVCGVPVEVSRTEKCHTSEYKGLLTLEDTDCESCIVLPASCLYKYGHRGNAGWFTFNKTVPVKVNCVNLSLLDDLTLETITAALQYVSENCHSCYTVSCVAYKAVNNVLAGFNVKLTPYQVSCFFDYLEKHQHEEKHHEETGDEPGEPGEPGEPSDYVPTMTVVSRETDSNTLTPDCDIEQKLRSILEQTDTESAEN